MIKRILLVSSLALSSICINAQNDSLKRNSVFIEYAQVISELKSNQNPEDIGFKYDMCTILLLDSTQLEMVEKIDPLSVEYFRESAPGLALNKSTASFPTVKKDIREIFTDKVSLKRILICLNEEQSTEIDFSMFDFPIYTKENKAIFDISGPTWSDTYFASLGNGVLQINWLSGIIE